MEFVRNMERRRLIKPQDILATLQSIPEDESESELQEHVFDSDSDEDFIPQNISSESEDSEGTNPEDIPSTSTGDRAHAVMLPRDHPPGRGQKKSAKRPRNERTTDNDGGEGNATTNTREGESEGILVSADGIQWKPVEIGEHLPGRRDSQNILREAPGPTGYARRNIIIDSPLSAWRLFFDSYILTHIKNCTLAEACRNNNLQFTLSDEELDAFIAIFYARGISGTNRHSISSIWCNDWGIPFCKATMSRDRFVEIMRFLRFDEKSTRSERLQTDKFALFSTVWDRFIENCIACYKPGPYITVDEQLFPSKTRCPFTQYMPSKPDKYGHKYWLAVDKRSKYLANGFPYLGKDDTRRAEDRLADHVVMKLLDPFLKKGRNVTTDNYFTSVKLAKQLKSKGTAIVGTLNKIRREVPKEIKSMKEELYNTKVFRNEDNFTLTVYQGKPNKNVVILSSVHPDVVVASDSAKKTPETVKFYNETKYGVDVVDQMARKYTTRTCTRRWPVHAFENALDFAGINAWIIFKEITHQKMSRKAFLQTLVRELSGPYVTDREKGSTSQVSTCSEVMVQTKFCQIKEKCKKNRSVGNCKTCGKRRPYLRNGEGQKQKNNISGFRRTVTFTPAVIFHPLSSLFSQVAKAVKSIPSRKFAPKFVRPYTIIRIINLVTVKLQLPVNNTFHVSLLKNFEGTSDPQDSIEVDLEEDQEYEVERVLKSTSAQPLSTPLQSSGAALVFRSLLQSSALRFHSEICSNPVFRSPLRSELHESTQVWSSGVRDAPFRSLHCSYLQESGPVFRIHFGLIFKSLLLSLGVHSGLVFRSLLESLGVHYGLVFRIQHQSSHLESTPFWSPEVCSSL
ncbi:uncharacterized protein [Phyllobates terribilis]|uniref:uncharacterized protein n=2 Tax=Phyllobates terribilis TaxID=111132 RepID=UPI003CCB5923